MRIQDKISRDDIIEMARQAGFHEHDFPFKKFKFEAFAKLVAEAAASKEREECAEICDRFQARDVGMQPAECAGAIRARRDEVTYGEPTSKGEAQ